jgi:D-alanyl-D-alanine carboxypeptidase
MSSFRDDHGYGLGLERDNGWIGHTGTIPGYNTVLRYHPDLHATIVVMVNDDRTVDGQEPAPAVFVDLARALDPAAAPSGTAPH